MVLGRGEENQEEFRMRRSLVAVSVFVFGLLVFIGCGSDDEGSGGASGGEDYEMVFIPGVTGDDFFHTIWLGAEEKADELGVLIEQQAPPKYEPGQQIPLLNAAVATQPDAILIAATDAEALQAPLQQVADRGIKIVTFDTSVEDPSFVVTHVSSDIVDAGSMVADELLQLTADEGPVMYIDHAPGVAFAEDLRSGFEDTVWKSVV